MKNAVSGELFWESWSIWCANLTGITTDHEVLRIPILNVAELKHGVRARLSRNTAA